MPILKYTLFTGASLLAIMMAAGEFMSPVPAATPSQSASSLELLRKMANHGELRPFASAAAAGPFLVMPVVTTPTVAAAAIQSPDPVKPLSPVSATPAPALDAQARLDETMATDKPARPAKKVASRKPKPRYAYVENGPRGPNGFFGTFQSW